MKLTKDTITLEEDVEAPAYLERKRITLRKSFEDTVASKGLIRITSELFLELMTLA